MEKSSNNTINLYDLKKRLLECYKLKGIYLSLEREIYIKVFKSYNDLDEDKSEFSKKLHDVFGNNKLLSMLIYRTNDSKYDIMSFMFENKKDVLYIKRDLERKKSFVFGNVSRDILSSAREDIEKLFDFLDENYDLIHFLDSSSYIEQSFTCDNTKAIFFTDLYETSVSLNSLNKLPDEYLKDNQDEILKNMNVDIQSLNSRYGSLYKN